MFEWDPWDPPFPPCPPIPPDMSFNSHSKLVTEVKETYHTYGVPLFSVLFPYYLWLLMHFLSRWFDKKEELIATSRATNLIIPDRTPEVTYLHLGISNDKFFLLLNINYSFVPAISFASVFNWHVLGFIMFYCMMKCYFKIVFILISSSN
jgi:hypothetical protein